MWGSEAVLEMYCDEKYSPGWIFEDVSVELKDGLVVYGTNGMISRWHFRLWAVYFRLSDIIMKQLKFFLVRHNKKLQT